MNSTSISQDLIFTKTVTIQVPVARVWDAITNTDVMPQWMSETPLTVITDWQVGSPITISGKHYKMPFENRGTVLQYVPEQVVRYSHLSTISRLPFEEKNFSIIEFKLAPDGDSTQLTLTLSNFPTETIYKHLAFYWNVTLELLRKFIEQK